MAKPNTKSVLESIKALKGGKATPIAPKAETEKSEKKQGKSKGGRNYKPKGLGNGGARDGAGRKPLVADEKRKTIKKAWEDFAQEEVEVTQLHAGTKEQRKIKVKRLRVVQEKLYNAAASGDVSAIREFNDRVGGKARQPVVGDQEEDPVQIDLGVDRLLERAYGDEEEDD